MEINKDFMNLYAVKDLIKKDDGQNFAFLIKVLTSDFFLDNKYHVVEEDTAEEQMATDFNMSVKEVSKRLEKLDKSGIFYEFDENEKVELTLDLK